jgi:hypothetical protein
MTKTKGEMKCDYCNQELQELNPPIEEYTDNRFCLNIFGWKLILLKDHVEFGCVECLMVEERSRERDNLDLIVGDAISREIEKGNLIVNK